MINLSTKFEVPTFTHCEEMKGNAKCKNWGALWWLGVIKVIGNITIQWSAYDFLFAFNRNYASNLYHFRVTTSHLLKVAYFNLAHVHLAPPLGETPFEFRQDFWHQKSRVPAPLCGVVCVMLRLTT